MSTVVKRILAAISLCSCTIAPIYPPYHRDARNVASAHLARALNIALTWPRPVRVDALKGAMLLRDGPPVREPDLAIARAILRTNPRLAQADALLFAGATVQAALANSLPPEFLGATLLQESAYDPRAFSSAGAIGIGQFMPETAARGRRRPVRSIRIDRRRGRTIRRLRFELRSALCGSIRDRPCGL